MAMMRDAAQLWRNLSWGGGAVAVVAVAVGAKACLVATAAAHRSLQLHDASWAQLVTPAVALALLAVAFLLGARHGRREVHVWEAIARGQPSEQQCRPRARGGPPGHTRAASSASQRLRVVDFASLRSPRPGATAASAHDDGGATADSGAEGLHLEFLEHDDSGQDSDGEVHLAEPEEHGSSGATPRAGALGGPESLLSVYGAPVSPERAAAACPAGDGGLVSVDFSPPARASNLYSSHSML